MKQTKNKNKIYNYRGFDLKSITWGYRDIFQNAIDGLYKEKLLGKNNLKSTKIFFDLLKQDEKNKHICFDHVLKNFLIGLNPENNWILKIPSLFSDWADLGAKFAKYKTYMGLNYFETWGKGGFGNKPEDVSYVLDKARYLITLEYELAYYFIISYKKLGKLLSNSEIDTFIEHTLVLFQRKPANAYTFLQLKTKTARLYTEIISKEARLNDINKRLTSLGKAISEYDIEIDNFSSLDSDDLIERGSSVVSLQKWLYLPARASYFPNRKHNIGHYMLLTVVSASALQFQSFNTIHGNSGASSSLEFIKNKKIKKASLINNSFIVFEIFRVLSRMLETFPGITDILDTALREEIRNSIPASPADQIIIIILETIYGNSIKSDSKNEPIIKLIKEITSSSQSFADTINKIAEYAENIKYLKLLEKYFQQEIKPLSFFPDFMYPGKISNTPNSHVGADFKNRDKHKDKNNADDSEDNIKSKNNDSELSEQEKTEEKEKSEKNTKEQIPLGYFYDEWSQQENDYFENYCCLREKTVSVVGHHTISKDYSLLSRKIKRVFEKLKPDQVRKEKYLSEGDNINIDMLTEYLSLRKAKILDKEKFYEKSYIRKRDLSVAVLIDLSGSTGEEIKGGKKIIDLEKESAYILGEGLAEIGDSFGIFGFSGSGRENAEYYIFKDFDDDWNDNAKDSLFSAYPKSSTRIGVAIRHTGYKLSANLSKKKLIILITDGKPMDSNYDHTNRYAQYDVRKANEENYRNGIDAFCISTEENKIEDLEIMLPFHRYVIIKNMTELPKILSQFYLKITK